MATVSDTCEQCVDDDTTHGVCSDCIGVPTLGDLESALITVLGAGDWTDVAVALRQALAG